MTTFRIITNPFLVFMRGVLSSPIYVIAWVMVLGIANMVVPMFFYWQPEAQVAMAVLMTSCIIMVLLTSKFGFTRLPGLGHILWIPLVIDITDVIRYIRGDREELYAANATPA